MNTTKIFVALLAIPVIVVTTSPSFAIWSTSFKGSRDQVRAACVKVGGELLEGSNETSCFNKKNGTGVSCGDDGNCGGSGGGPAPRVRLGAINIIDTVLGQAARADRPVPESLTSGNSGGDSAAGLAGPAYDGSQGHTTAGGIILHAN
jgi:hypothetical protein